MRILHILTLLSLLSLPALAANTAGRNTAGSDDLDFGRPSSAAEEPGRPVAGSGLTVHRSHGADGDPVSIISADTVGTRVSLETVRRNSALRHAYPFETSDDGMLCRLTQEELLALYIQFNAARASERYPVQPLHREATMAQPALTARRISGSLPKASIGAGLWTTVGAFSRRF